MISRRYRFIYIHIPKTGGNSVQSALRHLSDADFLEAEAPSLGSPASRNGRVGDDGQPILENFWVIDKCFGNIKHWSLSDYASALGKEINSFFIVATCRHPYDWCVSLYFFRKQANRADSYRWIDEAIPCDAFDEGEFRLFLESGEPTQASYLKLEGSPLAVNLLRYENLDDQFDKLFPSIAPFECKPKLPHLNQSRRSGWQVCLGDAALRAVIKTLYLEDFERFGYDPDG